MSNIEMYVTVIITRMICANDIAPANGDNNNALEVN